MVLKVDFWLPMETSIVRHSKILGIKVEKFGNCLKMRSSLT